MSGFTFDISGDQYRCGQLSARTEFHISRKAAPLFVAMARTEMLVDELAKLSDETADYLIDAIMPYVARLDGDKFANIYSAEAKRFMYADINGATINNILFEVLLHYVPVFFSESIDRLLLGTEDSSTKTTQA